MRLLLRRLIVAEQAPRSARTDTDQGGKLEWPRSGRDGPYCWGAIISRGIRGSTSTFKVLHSQQQSAFKALPMPMTAPAKSSWRHGIPAAADKTSLRQGAAFCKTKAGAGAPKHKTTSAPTSQPVPLSDSLHGVAGQPHYAIIAKPSEK